MDSDTSSSGEENTDECAVCLQKPSRKTQLPCGHHFCFLCVKALIQLKNQCAICRQLIPHDYLDKPKIITGPSRSNKVLAPKPSWFYEGRNYWWQYDKRTSKIIESAYQKKEPQLEVLVAGNSYIINLVDNIQIRKNLPHYRRRIKRSLPTIPKKGIAGVKQVVDAV